MSFPYRAVRAVKHAIIMSSKSNEIFTANLLEVRRGDRLTVVRAQLLFSSQKAETAA
jgi:hypothetical protein